MPGGLDHLRVLESYPLVLLGKMAARRTSLKCSGWLEMLGMRRKSSSSLRPCSRVCSRNSSGEPILTIFADGAGLVDEAEQVESSRGLDRPIVDPAPTGVVHL